MKHYYWYSPRGFCNESYLLSVDPHDEEDVTLLNRLLEKAESEPDPSCDRITRKDAEAIAARWRAEERARREGRGTETVIGPTEIITIQDALIWR